MMRPNFLYIGPNKSGSTWLYYALKQHPEIFVPSSKELFFFDFFYDKGWRWYESYFKDAAPYKVISELSHDYLYSGVGLERIHESLPGVKLMVCLRDPLSRAISAYLYLRKQGRTNLSINEAMLKIDELVEHGLYGKYLTPYIERFGVSNVYVADFDRLRNDPYGFINGVCEFLGVSALSEDQFSSLNSKVLASSAPRHVALAGLARRLGWFVRQLGFPEFVTGIKSSRVVNKLLYQEVRAASEVELDPEVRKKVVAVFRDDLNRLDDLLGTHYRERWIG